jgi:hypothetical protein
MNHKRHKSSSTEATDRQQPRVRLLKRLAVIIGLIVVIAVAAGVLHQRQGRQSQPDYTRLVGNWMRTDGDYIISIRGVDADGKVHAAYFNPNPIKVSQAKISSKGNAIMLFVELRDEGYPGSKYNLTYKPGDDILEGTYFQAQAQQLYEVVFFRTK